MFESLKRAIVLLDATGRRRLVRLCLVMLAAALVEVVSVGAIVPFTTMLVKPELIETNALFAKLAAWTGLGGSREFTLLMGVLALVLLVLGNALQLVTTWLLLRFSWAQGHLLGTRLLATYLSRPYGWFLTRNTSDMLGSLFIEVVRVVGNVITPALTIVTRGVTALCLIALLIVIDPNMALGVAALLGGAYGALYALLRPIIARAGSAARAAREAAHRTASEALGGIKDVKLNGLAPFMLARFEPQSSAIARHETMSSMMAQAPRYLLETVALGAFIVAALWLSRDGGGSGSAIPVLTAYAFAGYRLMPSLQQVYAALTHLKYNQASLDALVAEIADPSGTAPPTAAGPQPFSAGRITLSKAGFTYQGAEQPTLQAIELVIEPKTTIAIVGRTGSGKTTLIDLMLGLLEPTSGEITVDGTPLTPATIPQWQTLIGYVPQNLYITDDTLAANIAFGVAPGSIDMARVRDAARTAQLHDFIEGLEDGYQTRAGERGSRLSNGQRQRLGIARALYRNPSVLVLDEATSALDTETERAVMDATLALAGKLTIIMIAHRLHTIAACDAVYEMKDGALSRSTVSAVTT